MKDLSPLIVYREKFTLSASPVGMAPINRVSLIQEIGFRIEVEIPGPLSLFATKPIRSTGENNA
jgi:hypothetical protein